MTLPASCAECVQFVQTGSHVGVCHRHAPAPGREEFETLFWPMVRPTDRCGAGAALGQLDGKTHGATSCRRCVHWLQPGGDPVTPDHRREKPVEWWARAGYCTRLAPSPSSEYDHRRTFWKVLHADDRCGDGEDRPEEKSAVL